MRYMLAVLTAVCSQATALDLSPIDHNFRPRDWPADLEVSVRQTSNQQFDSVCGKAGFIGHRISCALVDFSQRKCWILVRQGESLAPYWEAHERDHCEGYDHLGESTMRDAWERYKSKSR